MELKKSSAGNPKTRWEQKNTIQEPKKSILGLKAPIWELETPMAQPAMVHQKLLNTKKLALWGAYNKSKSYICIIGRSFI